MKIRHRKNGVTVYMTHDESKRIVGLLETAYWSNGRPRNNEFRGAPMKLLNCLRNEEDDDD